ncbi:hypothetical protein [Nonomuraea turcica]|uniref:hypothetical protein n=1 Tax=Nonomuraea sp. G32 TaxID=3067274 RepID=UPI00273C5656|nr:hypothetical protein [Nonomuraea sp. G32]MDP4502390.1 hypothetical protein [Nonomuraea sp. G32]
MTKRLVGVLLAATVATGILATPAAASASETGTTARPHLLDYKIYFGKCEDTCRIKVRIKNVSRTRLYDVSLNARLWVNGTKVGACYDYVGSIRPKAVRWAGCTVRSAKLARLWTRYLDGGIDFNTKTKTNVHYEYYS